MEQEVLTIHVRCTSTYAVESGERSAHMVLFEGDADCPAFRGRILPGGCDTQRREGDRVLLSALYMLRGTDRAGSPCTLFVENEGALDLTDPGGVTRTVPRILTDSPALRWLETARLSGTIEPVGQDRLIIHIAAEVAP